MFSIFTQIANNYEPKTVFYVSYFLMLPMLNLSYSVATNWI